MSEETVRKRNLKITYGEYNEVGQCLMPLIRLRGKYLMQFGFNVGDEISVSIINGEITIKKVGNFPPTITTALS